jgi:transketolase
MPDFTDESMGFRVGKAQLLKDGTDLTIIATGHLVWEALQAAYKIEEAGISARVINIHTVKPIDEAAVIAAARETKAVITAEEHQINGGLGSAISEVLSKNYPVPMEFTGMPDCFGESGEPHELMEKYGMTAKSLIETCYRILGKKSLVD